MSERSERRPPDRARASEPSGDGAWGRSPQNVSGVSERGERRPPDRASRGRGLPDRLRLPLRFDADTIRADLEALPATAWVPHFNTGVYDGDWSGVALRAVGGSTSLYPDPAAPEPFADTDLLRACPHVQQALARLACPLLGARLMRLSPGAVIAEHRDYRLGFGDGEVRLHVPIMTSQFVSFVLDGEPVVMAEGECWYLDLNLPHGARNEGAAPRVHLVIDCTVNEWLTDLLVGSLTAIEA
jgi:hypothetical protein